MTEIEKQKLQDLKDQAKYQSVLNSLQVLLSYPHEKNFIKYLFENFQVGKVPQMGLYGDQLVEQTSFYRCGASIYEICLAAQPELTGSLIAEMKRDEEKNNVPNED